MKQLKQYSAILISIGVIITYFLLFHYAPVAVSKFIADWLGLIGLSFMAVSTAPVAYRACINGIATDRDRFIFSYWLIWTIALLHRIWIIFLALAGTPDSLKYGPVPGFIATVLALAAGYGAFAPLSSETPLQRRDVIIFSVAAGFSGIIAGIAIGVFFVSGWDN